jgi:hypothetical protein
MNPKKTATKKQDKETAGKEKQVVLAFYERLKPHLLKLRKVRNQQVNRILRADKNKGRGLLGKLVELGHLVKIGDRDKKGGRFFWYFSNKEEFYSSGEILGLLPPEEIERIAELVLEVVRGGGTHSVEKLASQIYPDQEAECFVESILPEVLSEYLELDIVSRNKSGDYKKGVLYDIAGGDIESVKVLRMMGQITVGRLNETRADFKKPEDILAARKASRQKLLVRPFDIEGVVKLKGPINVLFVTGMPEGHILTAEDFFYGCLKNIENHPELGPDIVVANGFVQGNFLFSDIMRGLTLDENVGFDDIDPQIQAAGVWFRELQMLPRNKLLMINESVDEKRTGRDYALKQMLKGQQWRKVFGLNLSIERQRFAKNKFFFHLFRFQTEVVIPYWLRIGRAPYNQAEMDAIAKKKGLPSLRQSEDIALVNIYWAQIFGNEEMLKRFSPEERKKTLKVVEEINRKYAGWIHRTPPPENPENANSKSDKLWAEYAAPVNLHALMAEEEKAITAK